MKNLALGLYLAVAVMGGRLAPAVAATSTCQLQALGELDLEDNGGSPTIEAKSNGKQFA